MMNEGPKMRDEPFEEFYVVGEQIGRLVDRRFRALILTPWPYV